MVTNHSYYKEVSTSLWLPHQANEFGLKRRVCVGGKSVCVSVCEHRLHRSVICMALYMGHVCMDVHAYVCAWFYMIMWL